MVRVVGSSPIAPTNFPDNNSWYLLIPSGEIGKAFSSFNVGEKAIFILAAIPQKNSGLVVPMAW
jgi:hypothetical protein